MATSNTTDSATQKTFGLEKWLPILPIAMAIWGWFTHEEQVFLFLMAAAFISAVLVYHRNLLVTQSTVLGPDDKPIVRPRFTSLWWERSGWALVVVSLGGSVFWYFVGPRLAPSASVTRLELSNITYTYGGFRNSRIVPVNSFYIATDDPKMLQEIKATAYAKLTITRNGEFRTKALRIEAIEFQVVHVPFVEWERRLAANPQNVVLPIRCSAALGPRSSKVGAHLLDDKGDPTEGTIILDNDHKFAEIHATFTAAAGADVYELYKISPIITTVDELGRNRTQLPCDMTLHVAVWNQTAADDDAALKRLHDRRVVP